MNVARLRRPLTAGLLGLLVVGLGHLYLRRYRRGAAWFLFTLLTGVVWVPESALEAVWRGTADPVALAPLYVVAVAAALDAVLVARQSQQVLTVSDEGDLLTCPVCGNDTDPDLDFCHWCTTDLTQYTVVRDGERLSAPNGAGEEE